MPRFEQILDRVGRARFAFLAFGQIQFRLKAFPQVRMPPHPFHPIDSCSVISSDFFRIPRLMLKMY